MAPVGGSQQDVLNQLMEHKSGVTLDELVVSVGLSRTAINQHLMALEREGFVQRTVPRKSGGRPQNVYVLTEAGTNSFPKQYSWFSKLLIQTLRQQVGEEQVAQFMYDLGVKLSSGLIPRLVGKNRAERIEEIVKIMNETGFIARTTSADGPDKLPRVECKNCVYHDLSKDYPEVCRFDIGFLSGLMGAEVEHQACVQRGDESCRFRFVPPA
ncbi:helix-turn-helix transcriptional regulator [Acidisphaera rubrifaciens]|uniref:Transcriptional regulator n=1 Tax=Acidisphaera rubrifaciens HS-AP3 TaxID=1231350 RepID=A0A0D6P8L4_9PROT|nr:winged helix-turn-helix transcriptional regulator [Acidisphaera rubrifaciens]GAN78017.1 transcriptional regulator [Acidisphaera rubrifaciens HS-AP3]